MADRWLWVAAGALFAVSLTAALVHDSVSMFFAAAGLLLSVAFAYTWLWGSLESWGERREARPYDWETER